MSSEEKKPTVQEVVDALRFGPAIVCYTKCWPCQFGQHFDPPEPHTWGDDEDFEHAKATGQPEPGNCGCWCAKAADDA